MVEDQAKIVSLGRILSLNEKLLLENQHIHKGIFSYIRWSKEEEDQHRTGLYIKTLELQPPAEVAFRLFKNWRILNFLNKFNISKLVTNDTQKLYAKSSALGMISIPNLGKENFVSAGMTLQRLWLTVTSLGLSMQPLAGILYLGQRVSSEPRDQFSKEQIDLITNANKEIIKIFNLNYGVPAMLFRIGYAQEPSARSVKRDPIIK